MNVSAIPILHYDHTAKRLKGATLCQGQCGSEERKGRSHWVSSSRDASTARRNLDAIFRAVSVGEFGTTQFDPAHYKCWHYS